MSEGRPLGILSDLFSSYGPQGVVPRLNALAHRLRMSNSPGMLGGYVPIDGGPEFRKMDLVNQQQMQADEWAQQNPLASGVYGLLSGGAPGGAATVLSRVARIPGGRARMTVQEPLRSMYPGIYDNPRELVARAEVAPEDPIMQRLFGVSRSDLFNIAEQGAREGNIVDVPFKTAKNPKGAAHASQVTNPRNTQRMQDIIAEAKQRPDLYEGMASWYVMDPAYQRFVELYGVDLAPAAYRNFNTLTGMASPGSDVLTELNRGSAAHWLSKSNRFDDFMRYGGGTAPGRPSDMDAVMGHPYHRTAQGLPMLQYLERGTPDMKSAKVPSYIAASGVPQTGFQTRWPVGDAHWSRLVGLPDVRRANTPEGLRASASVPEMVSLAPWWRDAVAAPAGLESVPAQAVVWGAGSRATGVDSPIGAPKLELLSQQIAKAANRMGVSPETARDQIFLGQAHAGFIDPQLLWMLGGAGAGAGAAAFIGDR